MEDLYPVLGRAAGDRQSAAQAAAQGGGAVGRLPSASNFLAYSYSFSSNPQLLAQANTPQAFNPLQHVDPVKWLQALQSNPDPTSCYPESMVGLPSLEQRLQQQQKAVEDMGSALEELRTGMGNLKHHLQAQSLQKLEECRQRQQRLQRQLLQVVVALERRALHTGAAQRKPRDEAQLDARLAKLEEVCCAPGGARARLEELSVQLRQLLPGSQIAGLLAADGGGRLGLASDAGQGGSGPAQSAESAVLRVTAQQGELLELLVEDLAKRRRDASQLELALGLGSSDAGLAASAPAGPGYPGMRPLP